MAQGMATMPRDSADAARADRGRARQLGLARADGITVDPAAPSVRMAQGIGGISSILQAHLVTDRIAPPADAAPRAQRPPGPAGEAPPWSGGAQASTAGTGETTADAVIEELERRLELEFLRMYGTSGG
jgi:hypothetical protein